MFDELHDPNPPEATSRHLAVVAERAAGIRRRRNATVGGLGAATLLVAGTLGIAGANRGADDPVQLADASLPAVEASAPSEPAPTTTMLQPENLPPAVPVNPDPEDLPRATPVNTGAEGGTGSSGANPGESADADGTPNDNDDSTTSDQGAADGSDVTDTATGTSDEDVLDVAAAAAVRADDPVTAISTSGEAVWFPSLDAEPQVVASNADRLDFLADGTAVINLANQVQLIDADGVEIDEFSLGIAATVDPTGTSIAGIDSAESLVIVQPVGDEGAIGDGAAYSLDEAGSAAVDLMWASDGMIILLVRDGDAWALTFVETTATDPASTARTVQLDDIAGNDLRFAGRTATGDIVLHDAGTTSAYAVVPAAPETATSFELDSPARSVWFDGDDVIIVDLDGALTDAAFPGTYTSARR